MNKQERKGARSIKEISPEIAAQLNAGEIESANLVEWLAVDRKIFLQNLLSNHDRLHYLSPIIDAMNAIKKPSVNKFDEVVAQGLLAQTRIANDEKWLHSLQHHGSDVARGWACYVIGRDNRLEIAEKLNQLKPLAADAHFGVREIAWLALRPSIIDSLDEAIEILETWALDSDSNVRRFASESTRPRGVWCAHIEALKSAPQKALAILEPLKSDSEKYVRDSVANWLNDASKTQKEFVMALCAKWQNDSDTKETKYICQRALRSLNKGGKS